METIFKSQLKNSLAVNVSVPPVIDLKLTTVHLGKQYRHDFWGLKDFSLEIGPGILGLLGPNGAGKSTFMRMLATITSESFLDEFLTWRELGYNMTANRPDDYDTYESLPSWARQSLDRHADDEREPVYTLDTFERAETHDPLWNAAQRQLVREGRINNYLRMLWGKKILQWSAAPREALAVHDAPEQQVRARRTQPEFLTGIFWVLGRYDRTWAPERPIFGVMRYA